MIGLFKKWQCDLGKIWSNEMRLWSMKYEVKMEKWGIMK